MPADDAIDRSAPPERGEISHSLVSQDAPSVNGAPDSPVEVMLFEHFRVILDLSRRELELFVFNPHFTAQMWKRNPQLWRALVCAWRSLDLAARITEKEMLTD